MLRVGFIKNISPGFTLIEVLVVIAIVSLLAGAIAINSADSNKQARDEKRQADLRMLQSALEMYKNKNGVYPEGCNAVGGWSGQSGSGYDCGSGTEYIAGLAPEFIPVLPKDPKLNSGVANSGYIYTVNSNRTIYKLMALNTVESHNVTYSHPFKSCDYNGTASDDVNESGWCANMYNNGNNTPDWCKEGNSQFDHSYGVWGGFATLVSVGTIPCNQPVPLCGTEVRNTSVVICKQ